MPGRWRSTLIAWRFGEQAVAPRLAAAELHEVDAGLVGDLVHFFDVLILEHADDERPLAREQPVERLRAVREPGLDRVEAARDAAAAARPAPSRAAACRRRARSARPPRRDTRRRLLSANMMPMKSAPASAAATASATRMQPQIFTRVMSSHRSSAVGRRRLARCSMYASASSTRSASGRVVSSVSRGWNCVSARAGMLAEVERLARLRLERVARRQPAHQLVAIGADALDQDARRSGQRPRSRASAARPTPSTRGCRARSSGRPRQRARLREEHFVRARAPPAARRCPTRSSAALMTSLSSTTAPSRAPSARAMVLLPLPGSPCICTIDAAGLISAARASSSARPAPSSAPRRRGRRARRAFAMRSTSARVWTPLSATTHAIHRDQRPQALGDGEIDLERAEVAVVDADHVALDLQRALDLLLARHFDERLHLELVREVDERRAARRR